jgi:molybdopterin-guanine dinucleotide biosynthesis protein A
VKKAFSALLLAGGASARMGTPKALVRVEGLALWRRQVGILQDLGPGELLISAGVDWTPDAGPWSVVRDRTPGKGPLEGIGAALNAMSSDLLLVLAVDMPSMTSTYLASLVAGAGPMGVVPQMDGFYQGLAAVYPRAALALLEEVLIGDDSSMQNFARRALLDGLIEVRQVGDAERDLFRNVNRPTDL